MSAWRLGAAGIAALLLLACEGRLRFNDSASEARDASSALDCHRDDQCGAAALHCDRVTHRCVACTRDDDCGDPHTPRCDLALHRCVGCGSDVDCGTNATCVPSTRSCAVRCAEGATEKTCPESAPTCDEVARICVQCKLDSDCAGITDDGSYCDSASGRCVHCTDDRQCPATRPRCDQVQHRCAECSDAADCPKGLACDPATLNCI